MAAPEPTSDLGPEEMLEHLSHQLDKLRTPKMAEYVLRVVKGLIDIEVEHGKEKDSCLGAVRCLPALQELDKMDIADLIKYPIATSMVTRHTSVQMFFGMLPSPERHNGSKGYYELAGLYLLPAKVLAARSCLQLDPFLSSGPDAPTILKTVVESAEKMGPSRTFAACQKDDEGVAHLEAGLARLALGCTTNKTVESLAPWDLLKHRFLTYLRWVVQGRKSSRSPFTSQGATGDIAICSNGVENLSTLSGGRVSGICANCGSQDATHKCKLCLILTDDHESEHTVSATTYCNESCRNSHFEAHKATCKEMRKLARSSTLFKGTFHHYLQVVNGMIPISAITMEQGIVTKHYVPTLSAADSPRDLAASQWQADAVMASFACADIFASARPILEFLIQPCCASVEFVNHSVKNADIAVANDFHFKSSRHVRYNTLRPHMVARLTLPSGSQYAFDPTAAQFGWREYLAPWDEYFGRRVHQIDEITVLESLNSTQQLATGESSMSPDRFMSPVRIKQDATTELINVFRNRKGGLRAIPKLSDNQFEEAKRDLTNAMEESVQKWTTTSK